MTGRFYHRLEAAEKAKRISFQPLRDMSACTDAELGFIEEFALRLIAGEQLCAEQMAAEIASRSAAAGAVS